jgi:hypothetical protein
VLTRSDHTRYLALDCKVQHNTTFFDDCCHPLLATENLKDDRKPYCTPDATQSAIAASYTATATATDSADADAETQFYSATASVESVYSSIVAEQATESASVTATTTSSADLADVTESTSSSINAELASALVANNNYAHQTSTSTEVEPTSTTTTQAAATTTASSGGDGSVMTGGFATYFWQGNNAGACGKVNPDDHYGIAIDSHGWWPDYNSGSPSPLCGKEIIITNTNNGRTVKAAVWDVCPTCVSDNSLDLSHGAFDAIASDADGMVPITWQWA